MVKVTAADGHEYDKSSSANATTAPTNEATLESVLPPLSTEDLDFVTIVDYHYNLDGKVPAVGQLNSLYGWTQDEVNAFYNNPVIIKALEERGIDPRNETSVKFSEENLGPKLKSPLTPIQLVVANSMLDLTDTRSNKKKLQDLGINSRTYNSWLRKEAFQQYLQTRAEQLIGSDIQHEAMIALADRVRGGDIKAIQYYHELTGRYTQASARNQGGGDVQGVIVRVVEILLEEIEDPVLAQRISDRLKGLVQGHVIAGNVEQIEQPRVAKPRELTPAVQDMMNKGLGYDS